MAHASTGILSGGVKTFATLASAGAALVSIVTFLHSWGVIGTPNVRATVGTIGARWIGVRPLVDTARAVRDTLHLAATITDENGSILVGARPAWASENPDVATVEQDGSVIARGPGATTIIAMVGDLSARTRIVVHQTVAAVRIAGDSAVAMAEGDERTLDARAFDSRGYVIPGRSAHWALAGGSAVTVDSGGVVRAQETGRAIVSATVGGTTAQTLVNVSPSPAAITAIKGNAQRARAGESLPERLLVRVVNRRGNPVEGTLVRFRADPGNGIVDPAAVVTDADGRARAAWSLGDRPGRQRVFASVERVDSALTLVAEADPVPSNTRMMLVHDSLSGIAGGSVEGIAAIRVTDSSGKALADVPVTWTPVDGGTVQVVDERTDSLGEARAQWTLGPKVAAQRLRVRLAGSVPPVMITAMARPDPAVVILQAAKARSDSLAAAAKRKSTKTASKRTAKPTPASAKRRRAS